MAKMIATRTLTYGTRRLKAGDDFDASNRDARVLSAIGRARYATKVVTVHDDMVPAAPVVPVHPLDHDADDRPGGSVAAEACDDLPALRAEYQRVMNKRPFPGWDAAEIRRRMADAEDLDNG